MNVLILTLDTLRAQNMSLYGYNWLTTPHLDRMAKNAVELNR